MMEIAVLGGQEFNLGFRLAGIRKVIEVQGNPTEEVKRLMADTSVGIVITDDKTLEQLDDYSKTDMQKSVKPVFIVLSAEAVAQDALRKMIIKSIGVDLWKE
ncbi:MAG TPA: V-type ATP synthase subunit F [Candidatus Nanoarchaeia archaeon]|nr:V-type ATP synthase subunit F [Candidatus Nanoarchaeia archaeon]